jgi:hypothetical protein
MQFESDAEFQKVADLAYPPESKPKKQPKQGKKNANGQESAESQEVGETVSEALNKLKFGEAEA